MSGIEARRVPRPKITNKEQKNSANTTRINEASTPSPIGSPNFISPPDSRLMSFGSPWFSIKAIALNLSNYKII